MNKTNTVALVLSAGLLRQAAELATEIENKQAELQALLSGQAPATEVVGADGKRKRVLSPEALKAIQAGQRRRWKNVRKAKEAAAIPIVVTPPPVGGTPTPAVGFETPPLSPAE